MIIDAAFQATLWELIVVWRRVILMVVLVTGWLINRDITGSARWPNARHGPTVPGELDASIPGTDKTRRDRRHGRGGGRVQGGE